ncbi:acyl carrier protein [Aneurinibacillus sp. BA2021]|nr:acyl carrier protein [Aneurinibacillus sp. BA2021]
MGRVHAPTLLRTAGRPGGARGGGYDRRMDEKALLELVAEILEVEVDEVALTDELDAVGWDSLANISFIAEVDEAIGVTIDADELANAKTVSDLHALTRAGA